MEEQGLVGEYGIRELSAEDAAPVLAAYLRNREHLARYEPDRGEGYLTLEGQRAAVAERLDGIRAGQAASWVLTHGDDVVGRVNLNTIVRGIFRSASVGYWVDRDHVGRGLATAAVGYVCDAALDLGLHRVQAGTYPDNVGSQTVLLRNGFTLIGPAPAYLFLAGEWRDHLLYQRVLHDRPPVG